MEVVLGTCEPQASDLGGFLRVLMMAIGLAKFEAKLHQTVT